MRFVLMALALLLADAACAAPCSDALARLRADDGGEFVAARYGTGEWHVKAARGRVLYRVHVWRGSVGKQPALLHLTEIPGTSGPNWGSERKLTAYRARIAWQDKSNFALPESFRVYAGPLQGGWTRVCDAAS
jgi:hypothetical protein